MNDKEIKNKSKFLSLILRHAPDTIQLTLDENGWANVEELILKSNKHSHKFNLEQLQYVVETNDKKRFQFSDDNKKIRASQGHSIDVELNLKATTPPEILYHGTVEKFIENIKQTGLQKMNRQYVHLSKDTETATKVAMRRGKPILLHVNTKQMHEDGYVFYLSENNVWLTNEVPVKYIKF
jgi:putative RNA 2'-phosphotransferase